MLVPSCWQPQGHEKLPLSLQEFGKHLLRRWILICSELQCPRLLIKTRRYLKKVQRPRTLWCRSSSKAKSFKHQLSLAWHLGFTSSEIGNLWVAPQVSTRFRTCNPGSARKCEVQYQHPHIWVWWFAWSFGVLCFGYHSWNGIITLDVISGKLTWK